MPGEVVSRAQEEQQVTRVVTRKVYTMFSGVPGLGARPVRQGGYSWGQEGRGGGIHSVQKDACVKFDCAAHFLTYHFSRIQTRRKKRSPRQCANYLASDVSGLSFSGRFR